MGQKRYTAEQIIGILWRGRNTLATESAGLLMNHQARDPVGDSN